MSEEATVINCKQCDGEMFKTKMVDKNMGLQVLGVIVFLIGLVLLFFFPFGTIIGLILMIVAARLGYRKIKAWKCKTCGYFFPIEI